jgi:hypothetical protein
VVHFPMEYFEPHGNNSSIPRELSHYGYDLLLSRRVQLTASAIK